MKISKFICILFFLILASCSNKANFIKNQNKVNNLTNYSKFLTASYSVSRGDFQYASNLLDDNTIYEENPSLTKLAFFF